MTGAKPLISPDDLRSDLWVGGFTSDGAPVWEFAPPLGGPDRLNHGWNVAVTYEGGAVVLGSYSTGTIGMQPESFAWIAGVSSN